MAIRWQSYRSAIPTKLNHNYTHLPALLLPCLPMTSRMQSRPPPPRSQSNSTHPLLPPCNHPLDLEMTLRVPLHLPLCHCLFVASCRRAMYPQHSQMWSSGTAINGHLEKVSQIKVRSDERGVPADARSSVLNLSSTRPFNASDCRLQSQSNHHM